MTESFGQLWNHSGIITMNEDCIIQSVDRACSAIFGHPLETMLGQNINILIPSPYKEQHDSYVRNYFRTGERHILGQSRLVEGLTADNQVFPLRLNVNEVIVDDQRIFVGVVDRLEEMHAKIKATEDGTIVSASIGLQRIFGYSPSELVGQNVSILMPEPYRSNHDGYMARWRQSYYRLSHPHLDSSPQLMQEYRVLGKIRNLPAVKKNGDIIPISLHVTLLETSPGDQPWLQATIETTDAWVVFTTDQQGLILAATECYAKSIAGQSAETLKGVSIDTVLVSRGADCNSDPGFWKSSGIMRLHHADGSIIPVDVNSWQFLTSEGLTRYSIMIKRRAQSESELLGGVPATPHSTSSDSSVSDNFSMLSGGYILGKKIGRGASGAVRLAFHPDTNQTIAVKIYDRTGKNSGAIDSTPRIQSEADALRLLIHPYITKLINPIITPSRIYLLMEYHRGGELGAFLHQFTPGTLPPNLARRIATQIVSAVAFCHSRNVVHRDLSLQNIMLDTRLDIKLVDFGLCAHIDNSTLRSTFCGTPKFAAPEMIIGKKYLGPSVDIWSIGVIFYYMFSHNFPFTTVLEIISCQFVVPHSIPHVCAAIFPAIFVSEPSNRVTIFDLLLHPYFDPLILEETIPLVLQQHTSAYRWEEYRPPAQSAVPLSSSSSSSLSSELPLLDDRSGSTLLDSLPSSGCPFLSARISRPQPSSIPAETPPCTDSPTSSPKRIPENIDLEPPAKRLRS